MPGVLHKLKQYVPGIHPVRGVCLDADDTDAPQDLDLTTDLLRPGALAETNPPPEKIVVNVLNQCEVPPRGYDRSRGLFSFFLDGTRRTYLVAEAETSSGRLLPLVAGQIGAAVLKRNRESGALMCFRHTTTRVLAVPGGGAGVNNDDVRRFYAELQASGSPVDEVTTYRCVQGRDPRDLAIAKINSIMQSLELQLLEELTNNHLIDQDNMVVVDGSVQFQNIKPENLSWLRYAVGVAKNFNTHFTFHRDRTEIGVHLVTLQRIGDRTAAFRWQRDQAHQYAIWYLRIRELKHVDFPLSGVIKVEKVLVTDEEREIGIPSDTVNNISLSLVGERYVTPYGRDGRWANLLYPIHLAERLQHTRQMSAAHFLRLF